MRISFVLSVERYPRTISAMEALIFYQNSKHLHEQVMIIARSWRSIPIEGEEDWFEELTEDEFESENFIEEFATAHLQMCLR